MSDDAIYHFICLKFNRRVKHLFLRVKRDSLAFQAAILLVLVSMDTRMIDHRKFRGNLWNHHLKVDSLPET